MRLAKFIRANTAAIVSEWEAFARTFVPSGVHMTPLVLRNHIRQILAFICDDMETPQSNAEGVSKSHGEKPKPTVDTAAETHASLRHAGGFNMDQMVSEYRALRASVLRLWRARDIVMTDIDVGDMVRFNEAVDQALTESIHRYSFNLDQARNLFLGILSHDLRNPLGAISMSARLTPKIGTLNDRQSMLLSQIGDSAERAGDIVTNLLDLTRARIGSGLPIVREASDLRFIAQMLVDEARAIHPRQEFRLELSGNLEGHWDKARIGQVFSNLIGNAVQYGFTDSPVIIEVEGAVGEVIITVHNEGVPIDDEQQVTIFNALTRAVSTSGDGDDHTSLPVNLGLGLYISKEIVTAHGGTIGVTSSEKDGTTFTVRLGR